MGKWENKRIESIHLLSLTFPPLGHALPPRTSANGFSWWFTKVVVQGTWPEGVLLGPSSASPKGGVMCFPEVEMEPEA